MRLLKGSLLLAVIALLAVGQAAAFTDSSTTEPQDADGGEPETTQCDEDDDACSETGDSGIGSLEDNCNCVDPANNPGGHRYLSAYRTWLSCAEGCIENTADYWATPDPEDYSISPLENGRNDANTTEGVNGNDNINGKQR